MCNQFVIFVTVTNCHKFEFVTDFVSLVFFWFVWQNRFGHILVTSVTTVGENSNKVEFVRENPTCTERDKLS